MPQQVNKIEIIFQQTQVAAEFAAAAQAAGLYCRQRQLSCDCLAGRAEIALLLTKLFFGPWQRRQLQQLAARRYDCFSAEENLLLLQKTTAMALEDDFCWGIFAGQDKERRLAAAICSQLANHSCLNWSGFCRFRLEGYREYLQTLLSLAADELLSEQEEGDYLRLLQGFLARQPQGGDIHVFLFRQGLYDICAAGPAGLLFLEGGRLTGCEDMLVSALLQLAPQSLCFHVEKPLERALQELLEQLFGSKLRLEMLRAGSFV